MASNCVKDSDFHLSLTVDARAIPVSYLSRTLRVLQAAVRETARGIGENAALFENQPSPSLLLDAETTADGKLVFKLYFADPSTDAPMPELSSRAFAQFMTAFGDALKRMPQRGLWGRMARRSGPPRFRSESERRLDELRVELRHFAGATLRRGARTIMFDGERVEIE